MQALQISAVREINCDKEDQECFFGGAFSERRDRLQYLPAPSPNMW